MRLHWDSASNSVGSPCFEQKGAKDAGAAKDAGPIVPKPVEKKAEDKAAERAPLPAAQASQDARSRDGLGLPDLADAAYYLCLLHGRHPGVIDHAATRSVDNAARRWLIGVCGVIG